MRALLLAAGFGKRLLEKTTTLPKPLLPIGTHRLIDWPLHQLQRAGIREVVVNLHYLGHLIRDYLDSRKDFQFYYSEENPDILGTGGGIAHAKPFLKSEPFVIYNSDIVCDADIRRLIDSHVDRRATATMVTLSRPSMSNNGEIGISDSGEIITITGHSRITIPSQPRVFAGIHVVDPVIFDYVRPIFSSVIQDFYIPSLLHGSPLYAYDHKGYWNDAGTPEIYEHMQGAEKSLIETFL